MLGVRILCPLCMCMYRYSSSQSGTYRRKILGKHGIHTLWDILWERQKETEDPM